MSDFKQILYKPTESRVEITLNRPEKRNALGAEIIDELTRALANSENESGRIVVLRGAGKDFCAGADLSELERVSNSSVLDNLADAERFAGMLRRIRAVNKPVVAAVHGRALAGGAGLATACDMVVATNSAQFCYTEVRIGFVPAMVLAVLRRNLPEKLAFEVLTTARVWTAQEALGLGFVNRVVEDDQLDTEIDRIASEYSGVSASGVALTKRLLYQIDGLTFEAALRAGVDMNAIARLTPDCRDGVKRFLSRT